MTAYFMDLYGWEEDVGGRIAEQVAQVCGQTSVSAGVGHRLQVDCACLLEGDGNGDGVVDVQDVLGVLGAYACTCDGCPE